MYGNGRKRADINNTILASKCTICQAQERRRPICENLHLPDNDLRPAHLNTSMIKTGSDNELKNMPHTKYGLNTFKLTSQDQYFFRLGSPTEHLLLKINTLSPLEEAANSSSSGLRVQRTDNAGRVVQGCPLPPPQSL